LYTGHCAAAIDGDDQISDPREPPLQELSGPEIPPSAPLPIQKGVVVSIIEYKRDPLHPRAHPADDSRFKAIGENEICLDGSKPRRSLE
jgi:hypothetical protein